MSPLAIVVSLLLVVGLIYYGFKSYKRSHPEAWQEPEEPSGFYPEFYSMPEEPLQDIDESPENYLERLKEQRRRQNH